MMWKLIILSLVSLSISHLVYLGGRNMVILIIIIEALFLSLSLSFASFYYENLGNLPNHDALFIAFALIVLSAAESAVILALMSRIHRKSGSILIKKVSDDIDEKKKKS